MAQTIYLLVGVPATGKTWIMDRLTDKYACLRNDDFISRMEHYAPAIADVARISDKPLLVEAPFSMNRVMDPLLEEGLLVKPVFIIEKESTLIKRYDERGRNEAHIIKGHLSRQQTFKARVGEYNAFSGDSSDVLMHLKQLAAERVK